MIEGLQEDGVVDFARSLVESARSSFEEINRKIWKTVWRASGKTAYQQGSIQASIMLSGPVPTSEKDAKKYFESHGLSLVKTLSDTDIKKFKAFMASPENWGISRDEFLARTRNTWAVSDKRAALIFETETHEAYIRGQHEYIDRNIIPMGRRVTKTFHHSGKKHYRPSHLANNNVTVDYNENYPNGLEGPGGPGCGCWESFEVVPEPTAKNK